MDLKYGVVIMKRKRERDTDDSADSQKSQFRSTNSRTSDSQSEYEPETEIDTDTADSEQMSGNSIVLWDRNVDECLLREMRDRLRRAPEFPDSLTKEQLVVRIQDFIFPVTRFDPKISERPASIYEGLVYDVFHDHELCSPLQAESHTPPPLSPPPTPRKRKPTSSGSALTSEEAVEKCQAIMRCYGGYLSHGQKMGFEIASSLNKYCNKIIAEQTRMEMEEFIVFLRNIADDFPIDPYCMSAKVPETEVLETEVPE
ncbi:hypothetical protein OROGR_010588 [Orobanche gracilis]